MGCYGPVEIVDLASENGWFSIAMSQITRGICPIRIRWYLAYTPGVQWVLNHLFGRSSWMTIALGTVNQWSNFGCFSWMLVGSIGNLWVSSSHEYITPHFSNACRAKWWSRVYSLFWRLLAIFQTWASPGTQRSPWSWVLRCYPWLIPFLMFSSQDQDPARPWNILTKRLKNCKWTIVVRLHLRVFTAV